MSERPIIFGAESVRAILAGRKTQTRRLVKTPERLDGVMLAGEEGEWCPYGQPGGTLWVRETWRPAARLATEYLVEYRAGGELTRDAGIDGVAGDLDAAISEPRWRSPIHMPRWAARLFLRVEGVRIERLQEISEADAKAEGFDPWLAGHGPVDPRYAEPAAVYDASYRDAFEVAWDEIQRKSPASKRAPWESNPWVWVVTFSVLDREEQGS